MHSTHQRQTLCSGEAWSRQLFAHFAPCVSFNFCSVKYQKMISLSLVVDLLNFLNRRFYIQSNMYAFPLAYLKGKTMSGTKEHQNHRAPKSPGPKPRGGKLITRVAAQQQHPSLWEVKRNVRYPQIGGLQGPWAQKGGAYFRGFPLTLAPNRARSGTSQGWTKLPFTLESHGR